MLLRLRRTAVQGFSVRFWQALPHPPGGYHKQSHSTVIIVHKNDLYFRLLWLAENYIHDLLGSPKPDPRIGAFQLFSKLRQDFRLCNGLLLLIILLHIFTLEPTMNRAAMKAKVSRYSSHFTPFSYLPNDLFFPFSENKMPHFYPFPAQF